MSPETKEALETQKKIIWFMVAMLVTMVGWQLAKNDTNISDIAQGLQDVVAEIKISNQQLKFSIESMDEVKDELDARGPFIDKIPTIEADVKVLKEKTNELESKTDKRWSSDDQSGFMIFYNGQREEIIERLSALETSDAITRDRLQELEGRQ